MNLLQTLEAEEAARVLGERPDVLGDLLETDLGGPPVGVGEQMDLGDAETVGGPLPDR